MQPSLLQHLRCPVCRQRLRAPGDDRLECQSGHTYAVRDGIPRFTAEVTPTAESFGYMWGEQEERVVPPETVWPYHLHAMVEALGAPPLRGLILDAGCGEGIDLSMVALDPACEIIGVELSDGGVRTSVARTRGLQRAHVVHADLLKLPLADETFDAAYSYGVVHHTIDPPRAVREIARTMKPGAPLLLYVYEDFSDRPWRWRAALALANSARLLTTRLRPSLLMRLCRWLSPVVYVLCTLPSRHFRWASQFPYRHGSGPWSLSGDLYDRLSAPIEERYSREGAARLALEAGLEVVGIAQRRGWMVYARQPLSTAGTERRGAVGPDLSMSRCGTN
jgi:SAM-dependent methyltransferase